MYRYEVVLWILKYTNIFPRYVYFNCSINQIFIGISNFRNYVVLSKIQISDILNVRLKKQFRIGTGL